MIINDQTNCFGVNLYRAFAWSAALFAGILLGTVCFFSAQELYSSLIYDSANVAISFVSLLNSFAPLLISVFLFFVFSRAFVFCIAVAAKAFSYSLFVLSSFYAFGRGAWFASFLLLFSAHVSFVLLIVLSYLYFVRCRKLKLKHVLVLGMVVLLTSCFVIFIIQPYLLAVF